MTGTVFAYNVARLLGIIRTGQTPATTEQNDIITALNRLLDNWSLERLNIPVIVANSYALVSGTASYTIGPGGTFDTTVNPRPIKIEDANVVLPDPGATGFLTRPIKLIGQKEYADIQEKPTQAVRPLQLYYDNQFPLATINLWPTPTFATIVVSLELFTWQSLAQFPDLVTDVALPPGYQKPLEFCVALDCIPIFGISTSGSPYDDILKAAAESKAAIRALNASNQMPEQDPPTGILSALPDQGKAA